MFKFDTNDHDTKCSKLGDLVTFIDYRGKTPEKSKSGIPLITAKNVKENKFSTEPREFIPAENYEKIMTRGYPEVGDVLFTTEAPLGNVCKIPNIGEKFCVGQRIITFKPNRKVLNATYLEYVLQTDAFKRDLNRLSTGSTVRGIRSKLLETILIPVPSLKKQNKFEEFVLSIDKSKVAYCY